MPTRWLIRLVVLLSVLLLGAMADAQQTRGGASGGAAPAGGGTAPSGGAQAPAPKPAPTPAPVAGSGSTSGSSGSSTGSNSGTSGRTGSAPVAAKPPTNNGSSGSVNTGTGSAVTGTGSAISGTGVSIGSSNAPITQTPAPPMGNPTNPPTNPTQNRNDSQHHGRHHHRNPNDSNNPNNAPTIILPQQYGWAPYTWWYNGNTAWMPPVWNDGYYGNGYSDNDYRADNDNQYDRVAPTPSVPAQPSPAQEQARAANAVQGMPAYNQAMVEFKSAQAAYDDAVARVTERLRRDPEYQRLVAQRDHAEDRVEAVQAGARNAPNPDRVLPAAQQKLQVSSKVTKMEQDAIAADPQASAAKAKLVEANEKLAALRKQAGASGGQAR